MSDLLIRFAIGGLVVTAFSMVADVLRPKSFAGLFGAAPSVALATLILTTAKQGKTFAATEAHSMMYGSVAFIGYAIAVSWILRCYRPNTLLTTLGLMPLWFLLAFTLLHLLGSQAT